MSAGDTTVGGGGQASRTVHWDLNLMLKGTEGGEAAGAGSFGE